MEYPSRSPSLTPGGSKKKTRQYILLPSSALPKKSSSTSLNQVSERKSSGRKKDVATSPSKAVRVKKGKRRNVRDGSSHSMLDNSVVEEDGRSVSGSHNSWSSSQKSQSVDRQGSSSVSSSSLTKASDSPRTAGNWRGQPALKKPVVQGRGIGKGAAKRLSKSHNKSLVHGKANHSRTTSKDSVTKSHLSAQQSSTSSDDVSHKGGPTLEDVEMMKYEEVEDQDDLEDSADEGLSSEGNSKKQLTTEAMDLVLQFVDNCVSGLCMELSKCAGQARRKTVTVNDVIKIIKRQHSISSHGRGWEELVHTHLPLDYAQTLLPCSLIKDC